MTYSPKIHSVGAGGTGVSSLTTNGIIIGNGTNPISITTAIPTDYTLVGRTGNAPIPALPTAGTGITISTPGGYIQADSLGSPNPTGILGGINLGFKYNAGVFSVCSADGTDLSSTNVGFANMFSQVSTLSAPKYANASFAIQVNKTFNDATSGASTIIGQNFGTTPGVAWTEDCPFYVYACAQTSDYYEKYSDVEFFISRCPAFTTQGPDYMGKSGVIATNDATAGFFLGDAEVIYQFFNPTLIGVITMTKNASDDWTVTSVGKFGTVDETRYYNFPTGQNGAATGSYFYVTTDTAPVFTNNRYLYCPRRSGDIKAIVYCDTRTTDGVGTDNAVFTLPFPANVRLGTYYVIDKGSCYTSDADRLFYLRSDNGEVTCNLINPTTGLPMQNQDFNDASMYLIANFTYRILY